MADVLLTRRRYRLRCKTVDQIRKECNKDKTYQHKLNYVDRGVEDTDEYLSAYNNLRNPNHNMNVLIK